MPKLPIILIDEMDRTPKSDKPKPMLRTDDATKQVRAIAASSSKVSFSPHALERSDERDITMEDMFRILRGGQVLEAPEAGNSGWTVKMVMKLRGRRDAGIVTIILWNGELLVKTVEWEDWK